MPEKLGLNVLWSYDLKKKLTFDPSI